MNKIINDEKLNKLLKEKQRLEMFSWIIPLISILSLLIILYLTSLELRVFTIVVLILLIFLIIGGYIFDGKITVRIHQTYSRLNEYFQNNIVPKLLKLNNPTIVYKKGQKIEASLIDEVQLFNNYIDYSSHFHYDGLLEGQHFIFHEVLFHTLVEYDTTGLKQYNDNFKMKLNYHWYTIDLDKEYPTDALYLVSKFENFNSRIIKGYHKYDFTNCNINLNEDLELDIYIKDISEKKHFVNETIFRVLNEDFLVYNAILAIYVTKNKLHIIIQEFSDLIDLTHSNKIVMDNLMAAYNNEQEVIKMIMRAFNLQ